MTQGTATSQGERKRVRFPEMGGGVGWDHAIVNKSEVTCVGTCIHYPHCDGSFTDLRILKFRKL